MESAKVVLRAVEKAYGAEFATIELDWSCERYHREGDTMPPTAWTAEPARRHVDRFLDRAFASRVAAAVREFFPGLHPDPVSLLTWVDRFSPDGRPLLGPAPSDARLVVAYGFSGSGFKFAAIMGEIAADFALNGSTGRDASSMAPNRYLLKPSTSR